MTAGDSREFLEQSLLNEEEESGIRRLGFDDLDCLEGRGEYGELQGCTTSEMGDAHPEDWWIAYATSDDEEDPSLPGDWAPTSRIPWACSFGGLFLPDRVLERAQLNCQELTARH